MARSSSPPLLRRAQTGLEVFSQTGRRKSPAGAGPRYRSPSTSFRRRGAQPTPPPRPRARPRADRSFPLEQSEREDDDPRTSSGGQHGGPNQCQYSFMLGHTCTLQAPSFPILSPSFGRLPPPRCWAAPAAPCVKHSKGLTCVTETPLDNRRLEQG